MSRNARFAAELEQLHAAGTYKDLRHLTGPTGPVVDLEDKQNVLLLCSNNYLGLANHPELLAAGKQTLDTFGAGTASVRFICGTFSIHQRARASARPLLQAPRPPSPTSPAGTPTKASSPRCGPGDVILSDALNHASIIDAIRLTRNVARAASTPTPT